MPTLTVKEFLAELAEFYTRMGVKMLAEQYRALFRSITLSYLNVDESDPDFDRDTIVNQFKAATDQYVVRMRMMGFEWNGTDWEFMLGCVK